MSIHYRVSEYCMFIGALILCLALSFPAKALVEVGHEFANLPSVADTNGGMFSYSDIKGTHTLFVFFSIYSDGAAELMETMSWLHNNSSFDTPFQVVGVSVDPSAKAVTSFISKKKVPFRVIPDTALSLTNKFAVTETPAIVLVGPSGGVLYVQNNGSVGDRKQYFKKISALLDDQEQPIPPPEKNSALDEKYKDKKLISPDAKLVAVHPANKSNILYISGDNVLLVYDFVAGKLSEQATGVTSASWSPDGKSIVYGTVNDSGIWKKPLKGDAKKISPEGRNPECSGDDMVAFIVKESEVWVAKLSTGKRWKVAANGIKVEWTPDSSLLLATDAKGRVWLVSPYSRASLVKTIFNR